jgi:hypothetical protein
MTDNKSFYLGLAIGSVVGGGLMALAWNQNRKNNIVWNNKEIKKNMLELIGHTVVVRIDSLSRATGNEILVF